MAENKDNSTKNKMKSRFQGNKKSKKDGGNNFNFYWIYAIIAVVLISINLLNFSSSTVSITSSEVEQLLKSGDVSKIIVYNIDGNAKSGEIYIKKDSLSNDKHKKRLKEDFFGSDNKYGPHYSFEVGPWKETIDSDLKEWKRQNQAQGEEKNFVYDTKTKDTWGRDLLGWIIPIAVIVGLWLFLMRRMSGTGGPGGQIFNIGKSKAQLFDKDTSVKVTFDDVAGVEEAKEEIKEIVDFLKNPKKYTALGAKIPKGALLVGPPGTGKTLLAKAVAGEAQVPFFSLSGSDFVEMFVGVGASRVRDLFKQAKEKAPSIIFIDEIDAIGRARGKNAMQGSNDERENTLNQLLTEMDGFGTNTGVIILAATNRADVLDKALLRPGRFDRQIHVDMPELNERKEIFKVHLKSLKLDHSVDMEFLAKQTPGFSGADIANLCNEAALIAARRNKTSVGKQDFLDAVDRIIAGLEKRSKVITPGEKKVIAYHEAGHATVSWLLEHASPLIKVTIVPRGRSLGAAWYLPEERQITTTNQMLDEMCATLGGRAAEKVMFDEISTGALSDLEKITKQAYAMVSMYGLNNKIGNISYYDSTGQRDSFQKPYSDSTAELIDKEVSELIESMYQRTIDLLKDNKAKLQELAELLLDREVIFREDLEAIFGKSKYDQAAADRLPESRPQLPESKNETADKVLPTPENGSDTSIKDSTNIKESSTDQEESPVSEDNSEKEDEEVKDKQ